MRNACDAGDVSRAPAQDQKHRVNRKKHNAEQKIRHAGKPEGLRYPKRCLQCCAGCRTEEHRVFQGDPRAIRQHSDEHRHRQQGEEVRERPKAVSEPHIGHVNAHMGALKQHKTKAPCCRDGKNVSGNFIDAGNGATNTIAQDHIKRRRQSDQQITGAKHPNAKSGDAKQKGVQFFHNRRVWPRPDRGQTT